MILMALSILNIVVVTRKIASPKIEKNHYSSEDREDLVIHFAAVHRNQVNLTNILFKSFFAADIVYY
jgi:hypothetical protein